MITIPISGTLIVLLYLLGEIEYNTTPLFMMQLNFLEQLYHIEIEDEQAKKKLYQFLQTLRYLKVNTLLAGDKVDRGVLETVDDLIMIVATLHHILTERQGSKEDYVKDCQNVTIYIQLVVDVDRLYDIVSHSPVPEVETSISGIVFAMDTVRSLYKHLKFIFRDAIQDRERQNSFRKQPGDRAESVLRGVQ